MPQTGQASWCSSMGSMGITTSGVILLVLLNQALAAPATDIHGGIKMGVKLDTCDNGQWNLQIDWDNSTDFEYRCQSDEIEYEPFQIDPVEECLKPSDIPRPLHKCMDGEIVYDDIPPRGGTHRPLWPIFGEYLFAPPQRWVHALEHGAAVFLYHPCAAPSEVAELKKLAKRCLRKHIITPYRGLDSTQPLAIVTYGCRLLMGEYNEKAAEAYVKKYALTAPESKVPRDGQYSWGLLHQAHNVSDYTDSVICPLDKKINTVMFPDKDAMIAENMLDWNGYEKKTRMRR